MLEQPAGKYGCRLAYPRAIVLLGLALATPSCSRSQPSQQQTAVVPSPPPATDWKQSPDVQMAFAQHEHAYQQQQAAMPPLEDVAGDPSAVADVAKRMLHVLLNDHGIATPLSGLGDPDGQVVWTDVETMLDRFNWPDAPSSEEMAHAREDLWVIDLVLRTIAAFNRKSGEEDQGSIEALEVLQTGRLAAEAFAAARLATDAPDSAGGRYVDDENNLLASDVPPPYLEFNILPIRLRVRATSEAVLSFRAELNRSELRMATRLQSVLFHNGERSEYSRNMLPAEKPRADLGPIMPEPGHTIIDIYGVVFVNNTPDRSRFPPASDLFPPDLDSLDSPDIRSEDFDPTVTRTTDGWLEMQWYADGVKRREENILGFRGNDIATWYPSGINQFRFISSKRSTRYIVWYPNGQKMAVVYPDVGMGPERGGYWHEDGTVATAEEMRDVARQVADRALRERPGDLPDLDW